MPLMTEQLENIEKKIAQLVEEIQSLRLQNAVLTEENQRLKTEAAGQTSRIGDLTNRLAKTQQALAGQRGADEKEGAPELRKQIDQYITEIDKCIAWLQNAQ